MIVSKRNKVVLENNVIKKTFIAGDIHQEIFVYKTLTTSNVDCAEIIGVENNTLKLSYLTGKTLLEHFIECEISQQSMQKYFQYWTTYMQKFHKALQGYRFNDVNYANFIVQTQKIVAVDFENVEKGSMFQDISTFICYGLFYKPVVTEYKKNQLSLWFNRNYAQLLNKQEWVGYLNEALLELNKRRKTTYFVDWDFLF